MENHRGENPCCQQLGEKLEKSETGRKKLRQAIGLLKEKLETTTQVLEVNESLRQECEKERQRADGERMKAEREKLLREKMEKEGLTTKEQLIQVLQRLDRVEENCRADEIEVARIRAEVQEAVAGVGAALLAVEAAQGLFQTLERNLLAKVNGAVQSSSRASSVMQSAQATSTTAQTSALAAQSLAKAVQKEVQTLASQVATLQKQSFDLTQHISSLQQDSQLRGPGTPVNSPDPGEVTASLVATKGRPPSGAVSPSRTSLGARRGVVLSKSQLQNDAGLQAITSPDLGDRVASLVATKERRPSGAISPTGMCLPPRGGMILSRSQRQSDSIPRSQESSTLFQSLIESPPEGLMDSSSKVDFKIKNPLPCQGMISRPKKGAVEIITGVESILTAAVNHPPETLPTTATTPSLYITSSSFNGHLSHKQGEAFLQVQVNAAQQAALQAEHHVPEFSNPIKQGRSLIRRTGVEGGKGGLSMFEPIVQMNGLNITSAITNGDRGAGLSSRQLTSHQKGQKSDLTIPEPILETARVLTGSSNFTTSVKMLKSITRMVEKEKKNRDKLEAKLVELQELLQATNELTKAAQTGVKRKRGAGEKLVEDTTGEKSKKKQCEEKEPRKRRKRKNKSTILEVNADELELPQSVVEKTKSSLRDSETRDSENECMRSGRFQCDEVVSRETDGDEILEMDVDFTEVKVVKGDQGSQGTTHMELHKNHVDKEGTGWESDFASTDDDNGEDWWAKKVLLSPTLPSIDRPPCSPSTLCRRSCQSDASLQPPETTGAPTINATSCSITNLLDSTASKLPTAVNDKPLSKLLKVHRGYEEASETLKFGMYSSPCKVLQNTNVTENLRMDSLPVSSCGMSFQEMSSFLDDLPPVSNTPSALNVSHIHDSRTLVDFSDRRQLVLDEISLPDVASLHEASEIEGVAGPLNHHHEGIGTVETASLVSGEKVSTLLDLECDDGCEVKRTLIESSGHLKPLKLPVDEDNATRAVDEMPTPEHQREQKQDFACDNEYTFVENISSVLHPLEETCNSHLNSKAGVEKTSSSAQDPLCNESSSVRVGKAFTRTKKRLYDSLNRRSPNMVQTGLQLARELAAIAADCNLSGEEVLGIFALAVLEVASSWQHDDILEASASPQAHNVFAQMVPLIEKVLSCKELRVLLPSGVDAVGLLLRQLQNFLITDVWSHAVDPVEALSLSPLKGCSTRNLGQKEPGCSCREGKMARAKTGGKIFASLCQVYGRLDSLQVFMYRSLCRSRNDNCWLLGLFLSFVSVCGKSVFSNPCRNMSSQAISAILLEVLDTEGCDIHTWAESEQNGCKQLVLDRRNLSKGREELQVLRYCLERESSKGLEVFLNELLNSVRQILTPPYSDVALLDASQAGTCMPTGGPFLGRSFCSEASTVVAKGKAFKVEDFVRCLVQQRFNSQLRDQIYTGDRKWQQQFWDLGCALELVAFHLGWKWTYNDLIVGHLWSLVTPGAVQVTVVGVAHFVGVLGRLGFMADGTELPGVHHLRERLCEIVQVKSFSKAAQIAAVQALMHLIYPQCSCQSPCTHSASVETRHEKFIEVIKDWYEVLDNEQQAKLSALVTTVHDV